MVLWLCIYLKKSYFTWVNFMVCEIYPNSANASANDNNKKHGEVAAA